MANGKRAKKAKVGVAAVVTEEEEVQFFTEMKHQVVVGSSLKAEEAVQFYKAAFGAEEVSRTTYRKRKAYPYPFPFPGSPDDFCAELKIGGFAFLVCEHVDYRSRAGGYFRLETDDVKGAMIRVLSSGAEVTMKISEDGEGCCGGGVVGKVTDPFGVVWTLVSLGR